jgi:hypothetical protein
MMLNLFGYDAYCMSAWEVKKLFKKPAHEIIATMIMPEDFNEGYLIDHVRKLK